MSGIVQGLIASFKSAAAAADEFFNRVTLLLNTSSTNGAQNNTFLDSSTNNFTITRNGNTTQGTFSPFSQTGWSNFFKGSGDKLTVPANAAFNFSTGDFTVECWVYVNSVSGNQWIVGPDNGTTFPWAMQITTSTIRFISNNAANIFAPTSFTVAVGAWNHFAVTRSGSTMSWFTNGTLNGTQTYSNSIGSDTINLQIGATNGTSDVVNGYVSNLRVVKGRAVYTSSFTPSTVPLGATSGGQSPPTGTQTSLLTCQSNRFLDNGGLVTPNTFTVTGTPSVQAFEPFAPGVEYSTSVVGGSGYFDGTGDYLSVANNTAFDLSGSTSWCIETWAYWNSVSGEQNLFEKFTNPSGPGWTLYKFTPSSNSGTLDIFGSSSSFNSAFTPVANQWVHIVCCRDNALGRTSWFINGVRTATSTTFSIASNASVPLLVGVRSGGTTYFNGYLSGARIVKGSTPYDPSQTTITIPTAPPTAITNTSLLLSATNSGIFDSTAKNVLETVGDAQASTTVAKWGTTSMKFDGTGDYLNAGNSQNFVMGTGDYTYECWVYHTSVSVQQSYINRTQGNAAGVNLYMNSSNQVGVYYSAQIVTNTTTLSTNTWYHIAATRASGTTRIFVNGTLAGAGSSASDTTNLTESVCFIGASSTGANPMIGYIDDVRITKGYARYTANFTPPAAAFALQ